MDVSTNTTRRPKSLAIWTFVCLLLAGCIQDRGETQSEAASAADTAHPNATENTTSSGANIDAPPLSPDARPLFIAQSKPDEHLIRGSTITGVLSIVDQCLMFVTADDSTYLPFFDPEAEISIQVSGPEIRMDDTVYPLNQRVTVDGAPLPNTGLLDLMTEKSIPDECRKPPLRVGRILP